MDKLQKLLKFALISAIITMLAGIFGTGWVLYNLAEYAINL